MEQQILHRQLKVNGIDMHVAELGHGPSAVLFLHGFPELWYSWRHQMRHLSARGYRTIAPDLRGYGSTTGPPPNASAYTVLHVIGDLVALLDALGLDQVFLVGHDWGAIVAWWFSLIRPDRVKALVNSSVPFQPRNPLIKLTQGYRETFGDGFYMCRFQKVGEAEAAFASADTKTVIRAFFCTRSRDPPVIPKPIGLEAMFMGPPAPLPSWLAEEDVEFYAAHFERTGFTGGLNYYRAMDLSWELTAPWTGSQVKVPVKFLIGDHDLTCRFPGAEDFIASGGRNEFVPLLEPVVVMEGVGHFLNQEKPLEFSQHVYDFISKFSA